MTSPCEHDYAELIEDETTGDDVMECCNCRTVLGLARATQASLPRHWFDHTPGDTPYITTAGDVLRGRLPRERNDVRRYIHICGNCQHWLGAVHNSYFENLTPPYDEPEGEHLRPPSFISNLMEAFCPKCGAVNYRQGSLVMAHSDATQVEKEGMNLTRYLHNRADITFWRSQMGGPESPLAASSIEMPMYDIGDYNARCPCCGYAVAYGDREFDFHHWDYDDDVGCQLCRECHSHIHRGMKAAEQDDLTGDWRRDAIARLYERATKHGLKFNTAHGFIQRFNIKPVTPERLSYIRGVVSDE